MVCNIYKLNYQSVFPAGDVQEGGRAHPKKVAEEQGPCIQRLLFEGSYADTVEMEQVCY